MKNRFLWVGILVLVFGICVLGCPTTSSTANYYKFGNVSEENCAQIIVSPVYNVVKNNAFLKSDYPFSDFVKIDGQGDNKQWQHPSIGSANLQEFIVDSKKAIVRVTPGAHTFTITFFFDEEYEIPLDIIYNDCKAGKGYSLSFAAQNVLPLPGVYLSAAIGIVTVTIVMQEYDIDEKGDFKYSSGKEVGKVIENLDLTVSKNPNSDKFTYGSDWVRAKKRMQ